MTFKFSQSSLDSTKKPIKVNDDVTFYQDTKTIATGKVIKLMGNVLVVKVKNDSFVVNSNSVTKFVADK